MGDVTVGGTRSDVALRARPRPGFGRATLALLVKDLRAELRARDTLPPMLAFALAVALLLAFSLPGTGEGVGAGGARRGLATAQVVAGFLWVTVLFSGLIAFARTYESERAEGALDAVLLMPLDRGALFAAKALANLGYLVVTEAVLVPVFALLWGIDAGWAPFAGVTLLVDVGFAAIGTLFASLAAQTRSRELLLPVLALPALVPVFIAAVELSAGLWSGSGLAAVSGSGWFAILVAFDVVFAVVGGITAEHALG